jgi:hypothetical protein
MYPLPTPESRWSSAIFLACVVSVTAGFLILSAVFQFPDILRASPQDRFGLFQSQQALVVPAYYLMSLSAVFQVFMAVALYRLVGKGGLLDLAALTAGVLAGVFQILGFFRWIILMPMFSDAVQTQSMPTDLVFALEKFANTYFGMTVGEHLGTLFLAGWVVLAAIRLLRDGTWGRPLAGLGLVSGLALLLASLETLGPGFAWLGALTAVNWGFYLVWATLMAVAFVSKKALHWGWWLFGLAFYASNVIPSLL